MAEPAELSEQSSELTEQSTGQSETTLQTTVNGSGGDGESIFDYESIRGKPELEAAYRSMQGAYTDKFKEFSAGKDKIAQYDQFMQNPLDTMRQLAQQRGYQLVQGQPDQTGDSKKFENWDDVMSEAKRQVMDELKPMFGEMQNMKKQNVEQALDNSYPDWRTYEDTMMENLQAHPTLVNDHEKLYQMSVPQEVLIARATKTALAKIQDTTSNTVQGQSSTTQQITKKPKFKTINEAAAWAAQQPQVKSLKV